MSACFLGLSLFGPARVVTGPVVSLLILFGNPGHSSPSSDPGHELLGESRDDSAAVFDFQLGTWEVQGRTVFADRSWHPIEGTLSCGRYIDGPHQGLHQEWIPADSGGSGDTEGTLTFLFDPRSERWAIRMDGLPNRSYFESPFAVDASEASVRILPTQQRDGTGAHLQRASFSKISRSSWELQIERSYDEGKNYFVVQRIKARRSGEAESVSTISVSRSYPYRGRVSTLFEGFEGSRGLATDDQGAVYLAARFAEEESIPILRVDPQGTRRMVARGLKPAGLAWKKGYLYVHAHDVEGGRVVRIDEGGAVEELGLASGDSLAVDERGNAYTIAGDTVTVLRVGSAPRVWARSEALRGALGTDFDSKDRSLVFADWTTGRVYRLKEGGQARQIADVPGFEGSHAAWLTISGEDVLVTSFGGDRVYRVDSSGSVTVVAGSGFPGARDGSLRDARFENPNGIAISRDGRVIFVAELLAGEKGPFTHGRLRKIELEARASGEEKDSTHDQ